MEWALFVFGFPMLVVGIALTDAYHTEQRPQDAIKWIVVAVIGLALCLATAFLSFSIFYLGDLSDSKREGG